MARSSIGITPHTKKALAAAKPRGMPWDAFLRALLEAADTARFVNIAESKRVASEEEAVERARARYAKYRSDPSRLISGTELRRRVHLRRLAESLDAFREALRLAGEKPETLDAGAVRSAVDDLDVQVHEAKALLRAA
jgi:hypothetical protein